MEKWKKTGRIFLTALLIAALVFPVTGVQKASAKVSNCTIQGISKGAGGYGTKLFTSVKFSGNKVTLKGKFKAKINGKKKTVKKLTIPIASNCVCGGEDETAFYYSLSKMKKILKKGQFITLWVTVKSGKVVEFWLTA